MNSNSWYNDFFFPRDAMHRAVLPQYGVWLSLCPSVTHFRYRYRAHIGRNSSKIISRPNSLGLMRWLTLTWCMIWCNGNTPKITVEKRWGPWGQEHIKAVIFPKWCKIWPRLLLRTNRKSHTRFRLAPKSMTSDYLERPKRHSCRNKQNFRSLNSFRIKIHA